MEKNNQPKLLSVLFFTNKASLLKIMFTTDVSSSERRKYIFSHQN